VVGKTVRYCLETGKTIPDLTLEEFRQFSKKIEADIFAAVTLEASVNAARPPRHGPPCRRSGNRQGAGCSVKLTRIWP